MLSTRVEGVPFTNLFAPMLNLGRSEMTQNAHLGHTGSFSLQYFANICLIEGHQNTKKRVIWCSG